MAFVRVFALAVVIGLLASAACAAPDPDWHINFGVSMDGVFGATNSTFGTKPNASDWIGPEDCPPPDGPVAIVVGEAKHAFAYTTMHGRVLTVDYRAPVVSAAKTWDIWLTATEPCTIMLRAYSLMLNPHDPVVVGTYDGGLASLALWRGSDKLWDWQPRQVFGPLRSFAYDGTAIPLRLVATPMPTPEPGSVVAVLTGLWGLVGYARKRSIRG